MTEVSAIQRAIRDVDKFLGLVEHAPENLEAAAASLQEIAGRLLLVADKARGNERYNLWCKVAGIECIVAVGDIGIWSVDLLGPYRREKPESSVDGDCWLERLY